MNRQPRALLAALLIALAAGVTIVIADDNGDGRPDHITISRDFHRVDLAHVPASRDPVVDRDQQLEHDEQAEAAKSKADLPGNVDVHEDTRDETPPGVSRAELVEGANATAELADKELLHPEQPGGAQSYRCTDRPVVNQSALTQRRVGVMLHFTVSDPGSLPAIRRLFNTPSFGASSNYGFDPVSLACDRWVPESRKAWAQLAANSAYVSIEITTRDRTRASWLALPALKQGTLAALVRDIARRHGVPLRLVDPVGCTWTPGITDHNRAECGNSHWDVGANFPWDVFIRQVQAGVTPAPLTVAQKHACDLLNYHRRRAHQVGRWYPSRARRAGELKAQIPTGRCPSKYLKH